MYNSEHTHRFRGRGTIAAPMQQRCSSTSAPWFVERVMAGAGTRRLCRADRRGPQPGVLPAIGPPPYGIRSRARPR
jgi:hypothetical protein